MTDRATLEVTLGTRPSRRLHRDDGAGRRILVLGDFSGSSAPANALTARRASVDTLESELARHSPRVRLDLGGRVPLRESLSFAAIEDFHPDRLVHQLAPLRELLELSKRLENPTTEAAALRDAATLLGEPRAEVGGSAPGQAQATVQESSEELFSRLLGRPAGEQAKRAKTTVDSLIREALGPASGQLSSEAAKQRRSEVLQLLTERLRAVLNVPEFRRIERAWRSVHWLVSRLEDEQAQVHIVDLPKHVLAQQLDAHSQSLDTSPFYRLLNEGPAVRAIVADYEFRLQPDDLLLLTTIGAIAARSRAPFIAQGDLSLCGCRSIDDIESPWDWTFDEPDVAQLWSDIRLHPAAQWIGLAAPRVLLRQPFGRRTDPIESFAFEELPPRPDKSSFAWTNPAFACAYVMAQAADHSPWPAAGTVRVPDLPMAVYDDGSGESVQAPIEWILTERARTTIEQNGLIAFAGGANTDYIATSALHPLANA